MLKGDFWSPDQQARSPIALLLLSLPLAAWGEAGSKADLLSSGLSVTEE